MKKLYLIRHAKSSWSSSAASDYDRPLNDRGVSDATRMAEFLKSQSIFPDEIVCSSALRAHTTARLLLKGLEISPELILADRRIYLADLNQLQSIMREFSDDWDTVFLVAHNPTITDCVNGLADDQLENVPTCGVYGMELAIDSWLKLRNGIGEKVFFKVPKDL